MNERRDLAKVGDLLDLVLGKVAREGVAPLVRLRQHWETIAGEWGTKSVPVAIRGSVVTLEVASGMDASMLRYAVPALLEAVRDELGDDPQIDRIVVRVRSQSRGSQ